LEDRTRVCGKTLRRFVVSGEMPIELSNSWFSAKSVLAELLKNFFNCRALYK